MSLNQREQMLAAAEDVADEASLLIGQVPISPSLSTSEKPMMAFSGVRSSCDMLARNSDFMRLASSARRSICCSARSMRFSSSRRAPREHALQPPVTVVEGGRVVDTTVSLPSRASTGELEVGDFAFGQHAVDARFGPLGVGEASS
jgi:hypothetical protein